MSAEVDQEAYVKLCWRQLWEAQHKAQITLPSGKVILPTDDAWDSLIMSARWAVQNLRSKKPVFVASVEDFGLKSTKKGSDGSAKA
jgi:hypothetical protein